ncbi:MAG TPA: nitroreductase/quinone reductase family protein, partial [Ktedonobacteraceae bacterium]|nr:nitroreductase/quinone reductase family protein [Ktedonobacteraceae bacterium]
RSSHPGWFYNLKTTPIVRVQVMNRSFQVYAELMTDDEAIAFWPHVLSIAPTYERYQRATNRIIPLVRLVPIEQIGEMAVQGSMAQHGPEELSFTKQRLYAR